MYRKSNICIETYNGLLVVDGWDLEGRHWNGWSIPLFNKVAADAIAENIGLVYDAETDTYTETEISAGNSGYFEAWKGFFSEEVGEHVYAIGACSWCWTLTDDEELKNLDMKIIDRRVK